VVGETKIKAKLIPAKAGAWAELGKNNAHFVPQQHLRANPALRSDQYWTLRSGATPKGSARDPLGRKKR
jgi:hypothetical protein